MLDKKENRWYIPKMVPIFLTLEEVKHNIDGNNERIRPELTRLKFFLMSSETNFVNKEDTPYTLSLRLWKHPVTGVEGRCKEDKEVRFRNAHTFG